MKNIHLTSFFSRILLAASLAFALPACQSTGKLTSDQISVLMDSGFFETDEGWELNLDARLLFGTSSAELDIKERESLEKIAKTLLYIGLTDIVIEGHTDSTGSENYNKTLARKRATMVSDFLVENGMPREKMTIKAVGSDSPVASNDTVSGRKENRRTVIIIPSK